MILKSKKVIGLFVPVIILVIILSNVEGVSANNLKDRQKLFDEKSLILDNTASLMQEAISSGIPRMSFSRSYTDNASTKESLRSIATLLFDLRIINISEVELISAETADHFFPSDWYLLNVISPNNNYLITFKTHWRYFQVAKTLFVVDMGNSEIIYCDSKNSGKILNKATIVYKQLKEIYKDIDISENIFECESTIAKINKIAKIKQLVNLHKDSEYIYLYLDTFDKGILYVEIDKKGGVLESIQEINEDGLILYDDPRGRVY